MRFEAPILSCSAFYNALQAQGIDLFAGVPDSLLKDFCAYLSDHAPPRRYLVTANEGSAIGLAAGHHLATGAMGLVYMQNSGLGNAVNPLTSLADPAVFGIPMLLLVGWRGEPGIEDEPQHVKMGAVSLPLLQAIDVSHEVLPAEEGEALATLARAAAQARKRRAPHALVVRKGTFGRYALASAPRPPYPMLREEAIAAILEACPRDALLVATTGMPARELFELRARRGEPHDGDLLVVGSMGHASQIALGVALARPERRVVCLDGDGAALMHLGGLATLATLAPARLLHIVLNNGAHDSVGGQPTAGFAVAFDELARACGYRSARRVEDAATLGRALVELLGEPGPSLLEVRIRTGARADLGRPTHTPAQLKALFMAAAGAPREQD